MTVNWKFCAGPYCWVCREKDRCLFSLFQKQRNPELKERWAAVSGRATILGLYMEKEVSSSYENQVVLREYEKNLDKENAGKMF